MRSADIVAHTEARLEWKPLWTEQRFLAQIEEEIEAVVTLGKAKSSLVSSLK